jgi:hypothetical protein
MREMENLLCRELARGTECSEEACHNASFPTTDPTGIDMELNQSRHDEKPAIGHSCFKKESRLIQCRVS